jgi:hypothetical protein
MLETLQPKEHVIFDPKLQEHLQAYFELHYKGRQTKLRFKLENPFKDVPAMMHHKIAQLYLKENLKGFALDLRY